MTIDEETTLRPKIRELLIKHSWGGQRNPNFVNGVDIRHFINDMILLMKENEKDSPT